MNTVALTGQRNFPITTDALAFMQSAYGMLENFSKLAGDNYILSGCTVTGASVSSGMVVIGGRLMPFAGGSIQENVKVVTTVTPITVGAGSREQTTFSAEFGTSTNPAENIGWGTLDTNRIYNLLGVKQAIDSLVQENTTREEEIQVLADLIEKQKPLLVAKLDGIGGITVIYSRIGSVECSRVDIGYYEITGAFGDSYYHVNAMGGDTYSFNNDQCFFGVNDMSASKFRIKTINVNEGNGSCLPLDTVFQIVVTRNW